MPFIADTVYDNGLSALSAIENLYITSQEATTFAEASVTYKLGTKASPTVGSPTDGATDGRRVIISAITDGVVNATGNAAFWAVTDDSTSTLLATGALSAEQTVTAGNPFTTDAISIGIRDAS